MVKPISLLLGCCLINAMSPAFARSSSGSMRLTANVMPTCYASTEGVPMDFGQSPNLNVANDTGVGVATIGCTDGQTYGVAVDMGKYSNGQRRMRIVGASTTTTNNTINYAVFTNSARSIPFETAQIFGSGGTRPGGGRGNGTAQEIRIYGRIIGGQASKEAGSYEDTVTFAVAY